MADSSVKSSVNSAILESIRSHSNQGSMVSGDGGQGSNALGKLGGGIDEVVATNQNLDSAMSMFVADGTDLKQMFDSVGQVFAGNIKTGEISKIQFIADNNIVSQNIELSKNNPLGGREGQGK